MRIRAITLHHIELQLKTPFTASYGSHTDRETILIEVEDDSGAIGWGECVALDTPYYTEETVQTAWHILEQFLIPRLLGQSIEHPDQVYDHISLVKRHQMAKAGLESAIWDLYGQMTGTALSQLLGGHKREVESGVAIGLQSSTKEMLQQIESFLAAGYQRFKVKIKPGMDIALIRTIREAYPDLPLMADANSAYTLQDIEHLQRFDEFGLLMIEQPLGADDYVDHAQLQQRLNTPICLDESLSSYDDVRRAIQLGSCRVVNIKPGRVGGLREGKRIHDLCAAHDIPVWCGGMLESGVGRAHNIALATLANFTIPGDISASSRYWHRDVIYPEVIVENGKIRVPTGPGIGYEIDRPFVESITRHKQRFKDQHS